MTSIVVIQARSTSSRLSGKALLHFCGFPLAILVAKRAASTGRTVLLATSSHQSDDALATVAARYGIACHRGPLDNVLGRFTQALQGYSDDTIVIRLTGDNLVPDGSLIDEVEQAFVKQRLDYICTTDPASGLPYGASVEVTRLGHLREADRCATTEHDREHVTPYVSRKFGRTVFLRYSHLAKWHFRATIDCFDDFISLSQVFPEKEDPVSVSWKTLVERLPHGLYQPGGSPPVAGLVMGTAQLGMHYGIVNRSTLSEDERHAMIKTAIGNGVLFLDTALAYGRSEEVIGETLATGWADRCTVVTKLSPLAGFSADLPEKVVQAAVENSVLRSCLALQQRQLNTLLLHRAAHLSAWNGTVWNQLCALRAEGRIRTLGVSVQSPEELLVALDHPEVGHIQLPFNILDHRWDCCIPKLAEVRARRSVVVHARSALLQGLLTSDDPALWHRAHVTDAAPVVAWLRGLAEGYERESISDLCLAWARSQEWIDGVVVGSDNLAQLELNITQFRNPTLAPDAGARINATRPDLTDETLDPARWKTEVAT